MQLVCCLMNPQPYESAITDDIKPLASNIFLRSVFSTALPLAAQPLFDRLDIDWGCTLLGCTSVVFAYVESPESRIFEYVNFELTCAFHCMQNGTVLLLQYVG